MDWTRRNISLPFIREKAHEWDSNHDSGMMDFMRWAGLVPRDTVFTRRNSLPRTSLDPNFIPVVYLAEVANEWDEDGYSTAVDFVDAIEFEVSGTNKNTLVSEVMGELGKGN